MEKTEERYCCWMAEAADVLRRRKAKNDFWSYCLYYDPKFFSRRLFLKHVADAFTRVYDSYQDGVIRGWPFPCRHVPVSPIYPRCSSLGCSVTSRKSRLCATVVPIHCIISCPTIRATLSVLPGSKKFFRMYNCEGINRTCTVGAWKQPGR